MAATEYTKRVVNVRHYLPTFAGDTWINDLTEHQPDRVMLTDESMRACGAMQFRHGGLSVLYFHYSGYIADVKTRIALSAVDDATSIKMRLYDRLTGVLAGTMHCMIAGEEEDPAVHGQMLLAQTLVDDVPSFEVVINPGQYHFFVVQGAPAFSSDVVLFEGWIDILPAVPA